jgi:hypothetical protein
MENANEYRIYAYEEDGDYIKKFPELTQGDGVIISNIFKANAFPDTGQTDICGLGFDSADTELSMVCGSLLTTEFWKAREFKARNVTMNNYFDVNSSFGKYEQITYAGQHSSDTYEGTNIDEIVTTYGTFRLDWDCTYNILNVPFQLCLTQLWTNAEIHGTMLPMDLEQNGINDMIMVTDFNLWYIDDGFVNDNAQIDEYSINPCLDAVWKQNTTVGVQIKAIDPESDNVQARAILYYGDALNRTQDSGWSSATPSGATIPFTFYAYNITTSSTLRLMARDVNEEHNTSADIIDLTFAVNTDGVEFGDCSTTESGLYSDPEDEEIAVEGEEYTNTDNKLRTAIIDTSNDAGIPVLIMIVLLLFGVDLIVIIALHKLPIVAVLASVVFDIFLLIICILMGLIVEAIVITLFAVVIILGALALSRYINSHMGGHGGM